MMNAQTELDKFLDKKAGVFTEIMGELLRSISGKNHKAQMGTEEDLADLIHKTMTLADLKGREYQRSNPCTQIPQNLLSCTRVQL